MTPKDEDFVLELINQIGEAIALTFGPNCEVCISDLDRPDEAVLYIYNGHVTGREVGSPLIQEAKNRVQNTNENVYINYKKTIRRNGPSLKSSTIVKTIGNRHIAFCINYDCTDMENIQYALMQFLQTTSNQDDMDILGINTPSALAPIIEGCIQEMHKPVKEFKKADRIAVVRELDQMGILQIQNSVRLMANALGVSRYSIYNYIKEVREADANQELSGQEEKDAPSF